jgi:hypothetical protein
MCQASSIHAAGGRLRSCDKASCPSLLIKQSTSGMALDERWTRQDRMVGRSENGRLTRRSAISPVQSPARQVAEKRPTRGCARRAPEVRFWSTTFRAVGRRSRSPRFGASEPRGGLRVQGLFSTGMRIPSRFRRELLPRRFGLLPPFLGGGPLAMATIAVGESVGRGAAVGLLPCRARR